MKYFTKELWLAHNGVDDADVDQAIKQSERNTVEYRQQLQGILPRIGEASRMFFTDESLHDGRLVSFVSGDNIDFDIGLKKFDINAHNTSVRLKVLGDNLDQLFTLNYSSVRKAIFDYPTERPLFHDQGRHIGDWGYDELTETDGEYLRHEILFASGTIILIEFKNFSYEKQEFESSRYL